MTALEKATKLVVRWTSVRLGIPPDQRKFELIGMIAELIERAEQDAYERGYEEGHGG